MRLSAIIKQKNGILLRATIFGEICYQDRTIKVFKIRATPGAVINDKHLIDSRYFITIKQYLDTFSTDWNYDTEYLNWLIKQEIDVENIWVDASLSEFMQRDPI